MLLIHLCDRLFLPLHQSDKKDWISITITRKIMHWNLPANPVDIEQREEGGSTGLNVLQ